jgi:hypothetical protein
MQQAWWTRYSTVMAKYWVMSLTTDIVRAGTRLVVSLHWRNVAEGGIEMTEICAMSSAVEMHAFGLTTGAKSMSALSKIDMMRGTMTTMIPSMTNLTDSAPLKVGTTQEESKPFPTI